MKLDGYNIELKPNASGGYLAILHGLLNASCTAYGDTAEEALQELYVAWDAMKESFRKHGDKIGEIT